MLPTRPVGQARGMVFPILSVTFIGLVVAAAVSVTRKSPPRRTLIEGVLGAWLAFILGALAGVLVDVIMGSGVYLAIFGHLAALAGAFVGARRKGRNDAVRHQAGDAA